MTTRLLLGDCRATLPTLEPESVQAVVTSPPYYGLRDYGTEPLVWGGDVKHEHVFDMMDAAAIRRRSNLNENFNHRWNPDWAEGGKQAEARPRELHTGSFCSCGAWLGSLGLEPTPEMFVEHLVEVFRHVHRVLRPDGVLWLNLGDSYAGSSNGAGDYRELGNAERRRAGFSLNADKYRGQKVGTPPGTKPKDLLMMPFRVAMALQADGWWLRSVIPWVKRSAMPESVTDRPATAVEYVFLLAKSSRYFWDADAVRTGVSGTAHARGDGLNPKALANATGVRGIKQNASFSGAINELVTSRNRRNSDWFFESCQELMTNEQGDPLALLVNPAPFKGAHFATFPPKLVEPMVKASTRPGDTVLDPFGGSGTVGLVAERLGRNAILCELKPDYVNMGLARVSSEAPLFTSVEVA